MDEQPTLDLGHLSAAEIAAIRSVLERDGILQREVDAKRQCVQQELHKMRKMSAVHGNQPSSSNACARCREPLGLLIGRGEVCPECNKLVCPHCKKTGDLIPASLGWVCTYCLLRRQGTFQTGDWFYGGHAAVAKQDQPSDMLRKVVVEANGSVSPKVTAARKHSSDKSRTLDSRTRSGAGHHEPGKQKSVDASGKAAKPVRKKKRSADPVAAEGHTTEGTPGRKRRGNNACDIPTVAANGGVVAAVVPAAGRSPPVVGHRTAGSNIQAAKLMAMAEQQHESEVSRTARSHSDSTSPKLTHPTKNRNHGNNRKPPSREFRRGHHVESSNSEESSAEPAVVAAPEEFVARSTSSAPIVAGSATEVAAATISADLADKEPEASSEPEVSTMTPTTSSTEPHELVQHPGTAAEDSTTVKSDPGPGVVEEGRNLEHSASEENYLTESSYHAQGNGILPEPVRVLETKTAPRPPAEAETEEVLRDLAETTPKPSAQDSPVNMRTAIASTQHSARTDESRSDAVNPPPEDGERNSTDGLTHKLGEEEEEDVEQRLRMRSDASGGGSFHGLQRRSNVKRGRRSGHGERLDSNASARSYRAQGDDDDGVSGSSVPASGNPMDIEATLMAAAGKIQQAGEASDVATTAPSPVLSERERARQAALERVRQKRAMSGRGEAALQEATASAVIDEHATHVRAGSGSSSGSGTTMPVAVADESAEQPLSSREQARRRAVAKLHMRRSQQAAADRTSAFSDQSKSAPGEAEDEKSKQRISRRTSTVVPHFMAGCAEHDPQFDDEEFHGSNSDEEDRFSNPRKVSVKRAAPINRGNASKARSIHGKSYNPDQGPISRSRQQELLAKAPVPTLQQAHGNEESSEDEESMNVDDYFASAATPADKSSSRPSGLPANTSDQQDEVRGGEDSSWVHSIDACDNGVRIAGDLQFELCYKRGALHVRLDGCTHLSNTNEFNSIHAKLYLLPDLGKLGKRITSQRKFSTDPIFNQDFLFKVGKDELHYRTLSISLWLRQSSSSSHNIFYGAVSLDCRRLALDSSWSGHSESLRDEPPISGLAAAGGHRCSGSISLAVKCHSTRDGWCRVDVRVQQGSGVSATDPDDLADPFVRGLLLPRVKSSRISKVCRQTLQPVWDELLSFAEVQLAELPWHALELSVWDHDAISSNDFLGAVRLGFSSANCQETESVHNEAWRDMTVDEETLWRETLSRPDEWIDAELPLRDITPHQ